MKKISKSPTIKTGPGLYEFLNSSNVMPYVPPALSLTDLFNEYEKISIKRHAAEVMVKYIEFLIKNHFVYDKVPKLYEMLISDDSETRALAEDIINTYINENKND